jgi:hypothetical protein
MPSPRPVAGIVVGSLVLLAIAVPGTVRAMTWTVTSTADDGSPGTLRQALVASADGDTIDATGVSGTILLSGTPLVVSTNVTILGPGPANLAIDGNAASRVFEVHGSSFHNGDVVISGLAITNGVGNNVNSTDGGGGIYNDDMVGTLTVENCTVSNNVSGVGCCFSGGGITNTQHLTISNSTITGNSSTTDGGAIKNTGSVSTISGNTSARHGGGIYVGSSTGNVGVSNSILSGNSAGGGGGGIFVDGFSGATATVSASTISGNSAAYGGGISNNYSGSLTVTNSTISGNSFTATDQIGGGIANAAGGMGGTTVINSTISGNSGPANGGYGGGIGNYSGNLTVKDCTFSGNSSFSSGGGIGNNGGGSIQIGDTVLDAGASGGTIGNFTGTITSLGYNLASDNGGDFLTATGDQINTDPLLDPAGLKYNGGPTPTIALKAGSPAIDAIPIASCASSDQRGLPRPDPDSPSETACDIGAFESGEGPSCVSPPAGLVGWWSGDGNANDISGNSNNGILSGGVTFAAGEVGQAFSFDGSTGSVVVPDSTTLEVTTEFTLDAWINPAALQSDPAQGGIISKVGGAAGNNGYQFGMTGNNTELFCLFNAPGEPWPQNQLAATVPGGIPINTWTHVACTYDNANLTIYVNGVSVGSLAVGSKSVVQSASNLRISADDNGNVFFNGLIDEAEVFNRALTAGEVQSIFTAASAGKCKVPTTTTTTTTTSTTTSIATTSTTSSTTTSTSTTTATTTSSTTTTQPTTTSTTTTSSTTSTSSTTTTTTTETTTTTSTTGATTTTSTTSSTTVTTTTLPTTSTSTSSTTTTAPTTTSTTLPTSTTTTSTSSTSTTAQPTTTTTSTTTSTTRHRHTTTTRQRHTTTTGNTTTTHFTTTTRPATTTTRPTTTTTTSTTTSSTTTTLLRCGTFPTCNGPCPVGERCTVVPAEAGGGLSECLCR